MRLSFGSMHSQEGRREKAVKLMEVKEPMLNDV